MGLIDLTKSSKKHGRGRNASTKAESIPEETKVTQAEPVEAAAETDALEEIMTEPAPPERIEPEKAENEKIESETTVELEVQPVRYPVPTPHVPATPMPATPAAPAGDELGKLREIVFGPQLAEFHGALTRMEQQLRDECA